MLINRTAKTSWTHIGIVVGLTMISFWFIKEAFAKPFVQWETYNQIRVAEIKAITEPDE